MKLPWLIPVPVKKSTFVSLKKDGTPFNIEVDFGSIKNFDTSLKEQKNVIESDLQLNTRSSMTFRLGSGRSGFYRGHYLKGIGRTLLAGNWNDSDDRYHGTGLLNAGGAVREYLATAYLKSKGMEHSIVPCEQILFRKLNKKTARDFEKIFTYSLSKMVPLVLPLDRSLQAITVKPGNFCRITNLNWLIFRYLNPGKKNVLIEFLSILMIALSGNRSTGNETPQDIAFAFEKTALQALEKFLTFHQAGIHWGSYEDNFTLDGRFLDLETPTIYGGAMPGFSLDFHSLKTGVFEFRNVYGFEFMEYLEQFLRLISNLKARLDFLVSGKQLNEIEIEFAKELSRELQRMVLRQPLFSNPADRLTVLTERVSKLQNLEIKAAFKRNKIKIDPGIGIVFHDLKKLKKWKMPFPRAEIHEKTEVGFLDGYEFHSNHVLLTQKWASKLIELDQFKKVDQVTDYLKKNI